MCIWNWEWGTVHNFLLKLYGEKAPLPVSLIPSQSHMGGDEGHEVISDHPFPRPAGVGVAAKLTQISMEELPVGGGSQ
jgi:hypothetical protein